MRYERIKHNTNPKSKIENPKSNFSDLSSRTCGIKLCAFFAVYVLLFLTIYLPVTRTFMKRYTIRFLLLFLLAISACTSYRVEKSETANIHLDSLINIPISQKVEGMIKPYRDKVNADMTEVLCQSSEALYGGRPESPLTNYCADLVLEESNRFCAEKYPKIKIDVSMLNRGGLRIPLPKGEIRTMTLFELMPFENEIVFLRLPGDLMLQFINHLAARGGEGVSGLRFGIKDDKAVQPEIGGKTVDTKLSYWLVTSDYIADGGDGSEILAKAIERINSGIKARDMFIQYFKRLGKEGKTVTAKTDGRIYDAK
jgi:2',3'-cyclic-nucleotide 2'-phosphodiesterase (5'-nucleotidase family)